MWLTPCSVQRRVHLRLGVEGLVGRARQQAHRLETVGQHHHRRVVRVGEGRTRAYGVDAGLLGGVHEVVEIALQRREGAVDGQRARDVGGVEVVALDAHVEQHELARRDRTGVVDPVQRRGVGAAPDDRVVADVVAHGPRTTEERALDPALAELEHAVPLGHRVGEPERGDVAGGLELVDLPGVLDQTHLGDDAGEVGVMGLVGVDQLVDGRGDASVHAGLARPRELGGQGVDVPHLETQRRGDLVQRGPAADPQLAVLPVAEELVGGALRARAGVEDALAVVDDEYGVAGEVAREVGVRGVGAEAVVGVVGPHLETAGRQHEALAREGLGQPLPPGRGVRRDGVRRQVQLAVAPALAHEGGVGLGDGRVVRLGVQRGLRRLLDGRVDGVRCLFAHVRSLRPRRARQPRGKAPFR